MKYKVTLTDPGMHDLETMCASRTDVMDLLNKYDRTYTRAVVQRLSDGKEWKAFRNLGTGWRSCFDTGRWAMTQDAVDNHLIM